MTTTITHHCDRCGCEIGEGRVLLRVETGPARHARPEIDLCLACYRELVAWLDGGGGC
jgi:hypothetical protein